MRRIYHISCLLILCVIISESHAGFQAGSHNQRVDIMRFYKFTEASMAADDDFLTTSSQENGERDLGLGKTFGINPKERFLSYLWNGQYPYAPVDTPVVDEELYYITDLETENVLEPFRPSYFTFFYPFTLPVGWTVYDPIELGVNPPVFPENINFYEGYWYGCPSAIDLQDPLYWQHGPNLFTNFCAYSYY